MLDFTKMLQVAKTTPVASNEARDLLVAQLISMEFKNSGQVYWYMLNVLGFPDKTGKDWNEQTPEQKDCSTVFAQVCKAKGFYSTK